jgi:hypothetical protein
MPPMKYRETIADKLSAAGWSWGYCSAVTPHGWRWIVDASRSDGRRFIVESDELLTAFLELDSTRCRCLFSRDSPRDSRRTGSIEV